jgi:hypothetical protein
MSEAPIPTSTSFERVFQTFNGSTVVQIWDNAKTSYQGAAQVSWFLVVSILSILFLILRALFTIVIGTSNGFLSVLQFISGLNIPLLPSWLDIYYTWSSPHVSYFVLFALAVILGIYVLFHYYISGPATRRAIKSKISNIIDISIENLGQIAIAVSIIAISIFLYKDPNAVRPAYDRVLNSSYAHSIRSYKLATTDIPTFVSIPTLISVSVVPQSSMENAETSRNIVPFPESLSTTSEETTTPSLSSGENAETSRNKIPLSSTPKSSSSTISTITSNTSSTPKPSSTTSTSSSVENAETSSNTIQWTSNTPVSSSTPTVEASSDTATDVAEPTPAPENEEADDADSTHTPENEKGDVAEPIPIPENKGAVPSRWSLPRLLWSIFAWLLKALFKGWDLFSRISVSFLEFPSKLFKGEAFNTHVCPSAEDTTSIRQAAKHVLALFVLFATTTIAHLAIQTIRNLMPGPVNVVASVLLYQPIFWGILLYLGYFVPFPFGWIVAQLYFHWYTNRFFVFFLVMAVFKFFKSFVHIFSFYFYTNPAKPPQSPRVTPKEVTVIVSTVGDFGDDFSATIRSILINQPARLIIATVGIPAVSAANQLIGTLPDTLIGKTKIEVDETSVQNKRSQFISAAMTTTSDIICYADDHVLWPKTFLQSALAPFEDEHVGMVGTVKAVERVRNKGLVTSILNCIGCIYLERHNFECTATYNIDGGVFVISGRTGLIRRSILAEFEFRNGFLNERFEFGVLASALMKPDDDNYMTRYCHKNGWKTVFHNDPDACIGTTIGVEGGSASRRINKLRGQLLRWARTTWRSNLVTLFHDRVCWQLYPWTTYAMFISSLVNLAIVYDPLMLGFLWLSGPQSVHFCGALLVLFLSKCVKPFQFFLREPRDIWFIPYGIVFGYVHSFIRLYALITITSVDWSGRQLPTTS